MTQAEQEIDMNDQDQINRDQGGTNRDQGATNRDQGATNRAQGATNRAQNESNEGQAEKNVANDYKFMLLEQKLEQLGRDHKEKTEILEKKVAALQADKDSALKWGLITLGSSVMIMGGFIMKLLFPGFSK